MTMDEYWRMFHLIRGDIEGAIASNSTYLKIHNLGASDAEIYQKYQRNADFWTLNTYALQTTFFIAFGRIFDKRRDAFSIQDLVEATMEYPGFFSKASLRERKREASRITGGDPDWLVNYIANAWEPTRMDLACLGAALEPHVEKVKQIYQPIRHEYFAHRGRATAEITGAMFSRTLIGDVEEILRFLHTLTYSIQEMAWNAARINLTNFSAYESHVADLKDKVQTFIRSLPGAA